MLKSSHQSQLYRLQSDVRSVFPREISNLRDRINALKLDMATLEVNPMTPMGEDGTLFAPMEIDGVTYTSRAEAGKALLEALKTIPDATTAHTVGKWRGMEIQLRKYTDWKGGSNPSVHIKGATLHSCELSQSPIGNITRMINHLDKEKLNAALSATMDALENSEQQLERAKQMQFEPFPQEQELSEKSARLIALTQELSLEKTQKPQEQEERDEKDGVSADRKPSLTSLLSDAKKRLSTNSPVREAVPVDRRPAFSGNR